VVKNSLVTFRFLRSNERQLLGKISELSFLEQRIKECFVLFLDQLSGWVKEDLKVNIHLLPNDAFPNDWIAMYNSQQSSPHSFAFSFNLDFLQSSQQDFSGQEQIEVKKAVLHELIHAFDHAVLKESSTVYATRNFYSQDGSSGPGPSNFWLFMHYVSCLRNEGVAMLAEGLFFPENGLSKESAWQHFLSDFHFVIEMCTSNSSPQNSLERLRSICDNLYRYSGEIMRRVIDDQITHFEINDKLKVLEAAFELDLSEWIALIAKRYRNEQTSDSLHALFSFLSQPMRKLESNKGIPDFYDMYAYDDHNYLDFLSKVCPMKLDSEAIHLALKNSFFNSDIFDVEHSLKIKTRELVECRNNHNAELVDWTLSYILLNGDVIDDQLVFVGYLDDWMIMDCTMQRIRINTWI
jgi:hypothetical protein